MITYNWDLAIKIWIGYVMINLIALTLLGCVGSERRRQYTWIDTLAGLVGIGLLIIPVFY